MSYEFLQSYWWAIISLLAALLVFLMFVQGGQALLPHFQDEKQKSLLINALGRKWEFTFTTLVTFGGAFFAAFPLFYSTSFGGAYGLWMLILFCFVIQAVSYQYRSKPNNIFGRDTYDMFLMINGFIGVFAIGVAVSTLFTGAPFAVNRDNLFAFDGVEGSVISVWKGPFHGFEAFFDLQNILFGIALVAWSQILGILYLTNTVQHDKFLEKSRKLLKQRLIVFLVTILPTLGMILTEPGVSVYPETGDMSWEMYKYARNFFSMPLVSMGFLIGVILILYASTRTIFQAKYRIGIWTAGSGTIMTVFCLFIILGYNNTAYYPSTYNVYSSLTIFNSSSSYFTLKVMSIVSLFIPFVVAYIWYAWRAINNKRIDVEELDEKDGHTY